MVKIMNKFKLFLHFINKFVLWLGKKEPLIIIILKILFDVSYIMLSKNFNVNGIYFLNFNIWKFILSNVFIFILIKVLNKYNNSLAKLYIYIFIIIMFIPISTVFAFKDENIYIYICFFIMFLLMTYLSLHEFVFSKKALLDLKINKIKEKLKIEKLLFTSLFIICLITLISIIYYNGIPNFSAFNFRKVYVVREEFYLPKYMHYLFYWTYTVIVPFFIVFYFNTKKYVRTFIFIIFQLFLFLSSAHKTILFLLPVIFLIIFLKNIKHFLEYFNFGVLFFTIISIFSYLLFKIEFIFDIFIRRLFFVPSVLKFNHFEFFQSNPKLGLIGTAFNKFFKLKNPYLEMNYPNKICEQFWNAPETSCDTGFLIEGYDRFGIIGCLLVIIVFSIILRLINNYSKKNGFMYTLALTVMPILLLNEGFLISSIFVGHFTVLIFILLITNSKEELNE